MREGSRGAERGAERGAGKGAGEKGGKKVGGQEHRWQEAKGQEGKKWGKKRNME